MADAKKLVPGTWFVTVTGPDGSTVHTIMTFTSDEGMVERAEPRLEAAIGVWKPGDKEDHFRFMFYRFVESLTITEPQDSIAVSFAVIQRVRSTNRMSGDDVFEGTATVDFLDAAGAPITAMPPFHTKQRAVRLKLVPE
jgi:hypothetical protein